MKSCCLLCLFCLLPSAFLLAQLQEDFADNDFSNNPAWNGDNASWTILSGQLRSNSSTASSSFYLSTPSTLAIGTQWEFYVKLSFNTSGTNYVDIYLTSATSNLKTTTDGYFIRIGGAKDEIALYKKVAGTTTLLINGTDGITNKSSNTLKIKITRTNNHLWNLQHDVAGTGSTYVSEGTITDALFTSSNFFGVLVQQSTSSFFNKHFFDDFSITPIDNIPPTITAINVLSANSIEVLFSETVNAASAQDTANYTVDKTIGNPASATISTAVSPPGSGKVTLTFSTEFISTLLYTLTITGVEDDNKNAITMPQTHIFTYMAPFMPNFRDIVINEIFADPTPSIDLPEAEFIELYNTTDEDINLTGYTFSDGSSTATFGDVMMPSRSYLVVCNTAHVALFTTFGNVTGVSSFPSLNNTGETLSLKNPSGKIIDKITYALSWYKDAVKDDGGWSLEQINPTSACNNAQNWQASTEVTGGTPGKQNAVYDTKIDVTPPVLLPVQIISANQLQLNFNEMMDSLLLKNGSYNVDNDLNVATVEVILQDFTAVKLTLNKNILPGQLYHLIVNNLADCPGNKLPATTITFGLGAMPEYNQLLITEIMADESPKVGLPETEYIELYNPTAHLLSLDRLTFTDGTSTAKINSTSILPGEYMILCASGAVDSLSKFGRATSVSGFSLNNSGEPLILRNEQGRLVYSVNYTDQWYQNMEKANGGWSLEMIDIHNPCGEENNWMASEAVSGGTPGKQNAVSASKPDLLSPQLSHLIMNDSLHLSVYFNEKLDSLTATKVDLFDLTDTKIQSASILSPSYKEVILTLTTPPLPKKSYTLTVSAMKDCNGNISSKLVSEPFILPEQGDSLDIILNEVLFNPRTGGVDFVELYNRSDKYINLKNWQLANIDNDTIANLKPASETDYIIQPGSYATLTTQATILKDQYPRIKTGGILVMKAMPTYVDDEGSVLLINNLNKLSDQFDYNEDFHFS